MHISEACVLLTPYVLSEWGMPILVGTVMNVEIAAEAARELHVELMQCHELTISGNYRSLEFVSGTSSYDGLSPHEYSKQAQAHVCCYALYKKSKCKTNVS